MNVLCLLLLLSLSLFLSSTSLLSPVSSSAICVPLPSSSLCSSILDYSTILLPNSSSSSSSSSSSLSPLESSLLLPSLSLFSSLSPPCRNSLSRYLCSKAYRPCAEGRTGEEEVCVGVCEGVKGSCSAVEKEGIKTVVGMDFEGRECNGLPSSNCVAPLNASFVPQPTYPRCEVYSGSICSSILSPSSPIYIPSGLTQSLLERHLHRSFSSAVLLAPQSSCLNTLMVHVCSSVFRPCEEKVVGEGRGKKMVATLPRLRCQRECRKVKRECRGLFEFAPAIVEPNCEMDTITLPTGLVAPLYPLASTLFLTLSTGVQLSTTCHSGPQHNASTTALNYASYLSSPSSAIACPAPLVHPSSPSSSARINEGHCALPCPYPLLTPQERRGGQDLMIAFISLTILASTFMLLTWSIFPSKRKQLPTLMFSFGCFSLAISLAISLSGMKRGETITNITCDRETQQPHVESEGGICLFQSLSIFLWVNFCVCWWCIQAVDVYRKVVLGKARLSAYLTRQLEIKYLLWGVSVPLLVTIGASASGGLGANGIEEYCFVASNHIWVAWAFLIVPILIQGPVAVFCMVCTLITMHRSAQLTQSNSSSSSSFCSRLSKFQRPLLFIFIYVFIFGITIAYVAEMSRNEDGFHHSTKEWIGCLFQHAADSTGAAAADVCGQHPSFRPNVPLWFFIHFCVAGYGVICALLYGTNRDNFMLWKVFLSGGGRNGDKNYKLSSKSSNPIKTTAAQTMEKSTNSASGGSAAAAAGAKSPRHGSKRSSEMYSIAGGPTSPLSFCRRAHQHQQQQQQHVGGLKRMSNMSGSSTQLTSELQLDRQASEPLRWNGNGSAAANEIEITLHPVDSSHQFEPTTVVDRGLSATRRPSEDSSHTAPGTTFNSCHTSPAPTAPPTPRNGAIEAAEGVTQGTGAGSSSSGGGGTTTIAATTMPAAATGAAAGSATILIRTVHPVVSVTGAPLRTSVIYHPHTNVSPPRPPHRRPTPPTSPPPPPPPPTAFPSSSSSSSSSPPSLPPFSRPSSSSSPPPPLPPLPPLPSLPRVSSYPLPSLPSLPTVSLSRPFSLPPARPPRPLNGAAASSWGGAGRGGGGVGERGGAAGGGRASTPGGGAL